LVTAAEPPGALVVVVPTATVAEVPGVPGFVQEAGVDHAKGELSRELTIAIDAQTVFVGLAGGTVDQPEGAVPTFVRKFQEPPVGVAGAEAASWKINHSKYVPPYVTVFPYKPTDSVGVSNRDMFFPYQRKL
jgi:hypothetical protein